MRHLKTAALISLYVSSATLSYILASTAADIIVTQLMIVQAIL